MELTELKAAIEEQNRAFAEFKQANDARLADLAAKGVADPLLTEKVERISTVLTEADAKLAAHMAGLEAKVNRTLVGGGAGEGQSLSDDQREYKRALALYLRKGVESGLSDLQLKALSVGTDSAGGYVVAPDTAGRIVKRVYESSPVEQIASVQPISTDALEGLYDIDQAGGGWVAETGARSETTTPSLRKWRIPVHECYAMPAATQQFLDDANIDVETWLADKVADKLSRLAATGFVTGAGVSSPRGFASYTTAATADSSRAWGAPEHVATGTSGGWGTAPNGSDKLIDLVSKLNPVYLPNARWAMNRTTMASARTLKANSQYIWLPAMTERPESTLLGYPISLLEDMATYSTGDALAVAFGDFKAGYQIVKRFGIRVLRDPFTSKPYVLFYTTMRVGGDVVDFNALKFLKFGSS